MTHAVPHAVPLPAEAGRNSRDRLRIPTPRRSKRDRSVRPVREATGQYRDDLCWTFSRNGVPECPIGFIW